ncbi:MAG: glycosyltransferase family 39 protein [Chloroflexi bacterium]|nr:glycosyltransferase family 39 protein [Chloroflexota bacterium]
MNVPNDAPSAVASASAASQCRNSAAFCAVLTLALALRLPFLSLPLTVDEGSYAYVAYWWLHGATLYDQVWIDRPQGLFIVFAGIIRLLGESPEALRLGVALLNLGTTTLVYGVALHVTRRSVALLAAALYAVLSAHPRIEGVIANSEIIMALPATFSLWLTLTSARSLLRNRKRPAFGPVCLLFAAGVAAGAAFLVKQAGIVTLPLVLTVLAWESYTARQSANAAISLANTPSSLVPRRPLPLPPGLGERGRGIGGFVLLLGFALPVLLSLGHGLLSAPGGYWEAMAGHRIVYGSVLSYTWRRQAVAWFANFLAVWPAVTPFALLAGWGLPLGPRPAAIWLWLLWSSAGLTLGGEWWGHYYIQLAGALAVLAALGIHALLLYPWKRLERALLSAVAAVASLAFTVDLAGYITAGPGTPEQAALYSNEERYRYGAAIAADLRQRVPPGRSVYVAYEGPEILAQAQRISRERYLFRTDLFVVPGAYEEMLAIVADPARRPAAIAARPDRLAGPGGPNDQRLAALLEQYYRPAAAFGPWLIYEEASSS